MENLLSLNLFTLLAHGALGDYDEEVFVAVVGIFLILMMYSWVVTRNNKPDMPTEEENPEATVQEQKSDRFNLD